MQGSVKEASSKESLLREEKISQCALKVSLIVSVLGNV